MSDYLTLLEMILTGKKDFQHLQKLIPALPKPSLVLRPEEALLIFSANHQSYPDSINPGIVIDARIFWAATSRATDFESQSEPALEAA